MFMKFTVQPSLQLFIKSQYYVLRFKVKLFSLCSFLILGFFLFRILSWQQGYYISDNVHFRAVYAVKLFLFLLPEALFSSDKTLPFSV